jgi:hypothetical protein
MNHVLVEMAALEHLMTATTNHGDLRPGVLTRVYPAADATEPTIASMVATQQIETV